MNGKHRLVARSTFMACCLLTLSSVAKLAPASQQDVDQAIERTTGFMEAVSAELYRPAFDIDSLLDELAYDEAEIIAFVRDDVTYEAYPGVMRGALGTLLSRAGNSADQAMLLARLLRDAGFNAQIARTELTVEQSALVLGALRQPVSPPPPMGDAAGLINVLNQWQTGDSQLSAEQAAAYKDYVSAPFRVGQDDGGQAKVLVETGEEIRSALTSAGARFDTAALNQSMLEEARDYFWVQFRTSRSAEWQDLHPVFHGEPPFSGVEVTQVLAEEIPDDLLHKLRFQVFIEKTQGENIEALAVTAPWERPVANLVGLPLTFTNIPDAMMRDGAMGEDIEPLVQAARSFAPGFGSDLAPGARFFDFRATLIDPFAAASPAAGLFGSLGDALAEATQGVDPNAELPILTAQWLEFTLISPSGEEQVFRRMTMDRIGAAARTEGKPPAGLEPTDSEDIRSLLRRHTFMVQVGEIARGYVVDSAHRHYLDSLPGITASVSIARGEEVPAGALAGLPPGWPGHLALFSVFDAADGVGGEHRNYRSGPALVIHSEGLGGPGQWVESIDIVTNPRRAVSIAGTKPAIDPVAALESGIWETRVEGVLLDDDASLNTESVFERADAAGIGTVAVIDHDALEKTGYGADTRAAMARDIDQGYYLVMPSRPPAEGVVGWWRIDPLSGEALGQISDGRGSVSVETIIGYAFSAFALGYGLGQCNAAGLSGGAMTCCVGANVGLAAFTFGIGTQLEGAMGLLAGIVLDANRMALPVADVCDAAF